jgi:chromosome segregation ATPase
VRHCLSKIAQLQSERRDTVNLSSSLSTHQDRIQSMETQINSLVSDLTLSKEEIKTLREENITLRQESTKSIQQLVSQSSKYNLVHVKYTEVSEELDEKKQELAKVVAFVREAEIEKRELTERIERLQSTQNMSDQLIKDLREGKTEAAQVHETLRSHIQRNSHLESSLADLQVLYNELQSKYESLKRENRTLEVQLKEMDTRLLEQRFRQSSLRLDELQKSSSLNRREEFSTSRSKLSLSIEDLRTPRRQESRSIDPLPLRSRSERIIEDTFILEERQKSKKDVDALEDRIKDLEKAFDVLGRK